MMSRALFTLPLRVGFLSSYRPAFFFSHRSPLPLCRAPDVQVKVKGDSSLAPRALAHVGCSPVERASPADRGANGEIGCAFARYRNVLCLVGTSFAEVLLRSERGFHSCRKAEEDGLPNATRMIKGLTRFVAYLMEPACRGPDRIHIASHLMVNQSGATCPPRGGFLI